MLERIPGPVAPVVVIGPYRSGKSFLLNQLLGVSCGKQQRLARVEGERAQEGAGQIVGDGCGWQLGFMA